MKRLIVVTVMSMIVSLGVSANAATTFSDTLTGFGPGDNYVDPAILDGSGLECSAFPGAPTDWELMNFDATGAIFGPAQPTHGWKGRNYLRTVETDYYTTSFSATVIVNRTASKNVYLGLGTGALGTYREPDLKETTNASVVFELRNPGISVYTNVINPTPGDLGIKTEVGTGAHSGGATGLIQLKMDFDALAETVTYSIDAGADGTYEDVFAPVNVSDVLAQMTAGDRGSIYFGTSTLNTMTDFSVTVVPEPATLALLGLGGLLLRKRKQ